MRVNKIDNILNVSLKLRNDNNQNKKQNKPNISFEQQLEKEKTLRKEIRR